MLAAYVLTAALLLRSSLVKVFGRSFEAPPARGAGAWTPQDAAREGAAYAAFIVALAYLSLFLFLYAVAVPYVLPSVMEAPLLFAGLTIVSPAAALFAQSHAARRFGFGL